jgi:hypothetical protein
VSQQIIKCSGAFETSKVIIEKRLAFRRKESGSVDSFGRLMRPGILPRRLDGRSGASVVRQRTPLNRRGDPDANAKVEATVPITVN